MRTLASLTAAAALVAAFGFVGAAQADQKIGGLHCGGTQVSHPCPGAGGNTVVKTFKFGPLNPTSGAVIDLDVLFGLDDDAGASKNDDAGAFQDSNDVGIIGVGLGSPQGYVYEMQIDADDGAFVVDVSPAEYDLSPDLQDVTDVFSNGSSCETAISSGVFTASCAADDGVCHDANGAAIACTGFVSNSDACWVESSRPPGATANGKDTDRHLQPEFIQVLVDDDNAGNDPNSCMVFVFVETDGNPGHFISSGNFDLYEPTGCTAFEHFGTLLEAGDGSAYVESIILNDGVSEYSDATGDRVQGPDEHLLLTPIGCDSDGDGVIDELDTRPADDQVQ